MIRELVLHNDKLLSHMFVLTISKENPNSSRNFINTSELRYIDCKTALFSMVEFVGKHMHLLFVRNLTVIERI